MNARKRMQEMFWNPYEGIAARFQNGEFQLADEETGAIRDYVRATVIHAINEETVSAGDFRMIVHMTETMEMAPKDSPAGALLLVIYDMIDQIGLEDDEI